MGHRSRKAAFQVAIGIVVMLLPILGFPYGWEAGAQYVAGILIVILALPFSIAETARAMLRRPGTCPPEPSNEEAAPNPGEAPRY